MEIFCIFWHLPSNSDIAKIVLRDFDLLFSRYKFKMLIYLTRRQGPSIGNLMISTRSKILSDKIYLNKIYLNKIYLNKIYLNKIYQTKKNILDKTYPTKNITNYICWTKYTRTKHTWKKYARQYIP